MVRFVSTQEIIGNVFGWRFYPTGTGFSCSFFWFFSLSRQRKEIRNPSFQPSTTEWKPMNGVISQGKNSMNARLQEAHGKQRESFFCWAFVTNLKLMPWCISFRHDSRWCASSAPREQFGMYLNGFATLREPGFLCSFFWFFSLELTKKRTTGSFF